MYDKRGNILTLQRNGLNGGTFTSNGYTGATYGMIDNMTYTYNDKNQATTISDASMGNKGYKYYVSSPGDFRYDANGNLIYDRVKAISNIIYNYLNLPVTIQMNGGTKIDFIYDASGAKLRKTTTTYGTVTGVYDYVNGVEYKNNTLERISNTEGAVTKNTSGVYEYEYALRDHLGNTRVTFKDANNDGIVTSTDICQTNHYYPFGLNMEGNWNMTGCNGEGNKYQYNGKELNTDFGLGWNDYGARFYDAAVGRWNGIDPKASKYNRLSPYNYALNCPINVIDPDGRDVIILYKDDDGKEQKFTYKYEKDRKVDDKMAKTFLGKAISALDKIASKTNGGKLVQGLVDNKGTTNIKQTEGDNTTGYGDNETTISFNPDTQQAVPTLDSEGGSKNVNADPFLALGHELGHSEDHLDGTNVDLTQTWWNKTYSNGETRQVANTELNATHRENQIRSEHGINLRSYYGSNKAGGVSGQELINPKTKESLYFNQDNSTNYKKVEKDGYKY